MINLFIVKIMKKRLYHDYFHVTRFFFSNKNFNYLIFLDSYVDLFRDIFLQHFLSKKDFLNDFLLNPVYGNLK